jgi:hypothetical protein
MKCFFAALAVFLSLMFAAGRAEAAPRSSCGAVWPRDYPSPGSPPVAQVWHAVTGVPGGGLPAQTPACPGLRAQGVTLLVAVQASFRHRGGGADLLPAFLHVSAFPGIRYWSVSGRQWQPLVTSATALTGEDPAGKDFGRPRADFTAAEAVVGKGLFVSQRDGHSSGAAVYRMTVLKAGADELVVGMENVNSIKFLLFPLFRPGDIQVVYAFRRLSPGVWGYRNLCGIREAGMAAGGDHTASYVNRAVAMYRHIAGIPTDQEPPLMRDNPAPPRLTQGGGK